MSILKYFTSNETSTGKEDNVIFPFLQSISVSSKEFESIVERIKPAEKSKKNYLQRGGQKKITKYAKLYGIANAVRRYSKEFPNISKSTVRGWLKEFRGELTRKVPIEEIVISNKHGRPLYLPEELDEKLRTFLIAQRRAGGNINPHTVYGVLMGLIKSNLYLYGGYLEFTATDACLYSLYKTMNFVR